MSAYLDFDAMELVGKKDVDEIIQLFCNLGYTLQSRDYDTILVYQALH